jgi:hypothetical protein
VKKGSTQEVAEAVSSSNFEKLVAVVVEDTRNPAEEEEVDRRTAGEGVVEEQGVGFLEHHNVVMKLKVRTHCSENKTGLMEQTHHHHCHRQQYHCNSKLGYTDLRAVEMMKEEVVALLLVEGSGSTADRKTIA